MATSQETPGPPDGEEGSHRRAPRGAWSAGTWVLGSSLHPGRGRQPQPVAAAPCLQDHGIT